MFWVFDVVIRFINKLDFSCFETTTFSLNEIAPFKNLILFKIKIIHISVDSIVWGYSAL